MIIPEHTPAWTKTIRFSIIPSTPPEGGPIPRIMKFGNKIVKAILESPFHKLMSDSTLVIEYKGRKSGKRLSTPVNYTLENGTVRITSQKDRVWWRNLKDNPEVKLRLRGKQLRGNAAVFENPLDAANHFAAFLKAAPRMARYFKVAVLEDGSFDPEDLALAAKNMVVIVVSIE
jgi:deazaflavin-dependent oxidoreductase (nitroreductase family)